MPTNLETAAESYVRARNLSRGTRDKYLSTLRKWKRWGGDVPIEELTRKDIREFLDRVHEHAVSEEGTNPGRTANKAWENLRAVMSWAWEQELIESLPRFPKPRPQRNVAGRHYLTKAELNALYFATHSMKRPRGWGQRIRRRMSVLSGAIPERGMICLKSPLRIDGRRLESSVVATNGT